jgi:hypothetical protein|tara:strand:+ start:111 stop:515 length:405 start_codon:yes stop_codon:yes gene_type:complete
MSIEIFGICDPAFNAVKLALQENFDSGDEVGEAVAVWAEGRQVVDLWAGHRDAARRLPWQRDTIACMFSVGNPGGVVPDLAQAVAEIGVAAYSLAFLKQLFLGCEQILVAPPLFAADEGNPVGQIIFRLLGRIP